MLSVTFTNKMSFKKTEFYSPSEKNKILSTIVKNILEIAANSSKCDSSGSEVSEIYRFSIKLENKSRWSCQWERSTDDNGQLLYGYLQIEFRRWVIRTPHADKINAYIVGTAEIRKNRETPPGSIYPLLNGNRFERLRIIKGQALNLSYFYNWEKQKKIYRECIYPECLLFVKQVLPKNGTVLELCGGDGEFAKSVFEQNKETIGRYFLIDINEESIKKAGVALKEEIETDKLRAIQSCIKKKELLADGTCVDLIIGIGALTEQVMESKQDALEALKNSLLYLRKGGYVLLTGLTSSWISSEDFEKLGIRVLNCVAPTAYYKEIAPEFYIAQKADSEEKTKPWRFFSSPSMLPPPSGIFRGRH
jgi:hypothetical protein